MDRKPATVALSLVASWCGLPMQSVLLLPGDRCRPFVIGDRRDASFPVDPALMGGEVAWTLVEADGTVCVPPRAGSSIAGTRLNLARGQRVVVTFESVSFEIRAVSPPRSLRLPLEIDWKALALSSAGILMFGLLVVLVLRLGAAMPPWARDRLDAMEGAFLSLAGEADDLLARVAPLWLPAPGRSADREHVLPCQPVTVIELGSSSAAVPGGGGAGYGQGPLRQQGGGHGIDWSGGGSDGAGHEAGSLLGYGMCMLPAPSGARE